MTVTGDELSSEIFLEDDIVASEPYQPVAEPQVIFLTGATGFLGAFVLSELLRLTQAHIYCLVRAAGDAAQQRVLENLAHYGLAPEAFYSRVFFVCGDLEAPDFNLAPEICAWLATHVDTIYHLAASVSFMSTYEESKPANVDGLKHVLRLACQHRTKWVHYSSTYAVFNTDAYLLARVVYENELAGTSAGLERGYDRSKWVAEKLCELARTRGIPVSIYRTGFLSGDTRFGIHNKMDPISQALSVTLRTGYTLNLEGYLHLTPVDFCSTALVRLSLIPETANRIFHLVQEFPLTGNQITTWLREEGYDIQLVAFSEWYEHLKAACRTYPEFLPILYLFSVNKGRSFGEGENLSSLLFDSSGVRHFLDPVYHCPKLERTLLKRYVAYILNPHAAPAPQSPHLVTA